MMLFAPAKNNTIAEIVRIIQVVLKIVSSGIVMQDMNVILRRSD